jgi:hypothetical protein
MCLFSDDPDIVTASAAATEAKAVPQHTHGGAGGRGCIAPTHL